MTGARWPDELSHLLTWVQDGVVSRRQLRDLGACENDVRRMLRRRELSTVHPGVYVSHTGPLTWEQRAWAAVLVHAPAALTRQSALPHPPLRAPIQVAIDDDRTVRAVPGVHAVRTARWRSRTAHGSAPPRIAPAEAAVEIAADRGDATASYALFARLCQDRLCEPSDLAAALRGRRGVPERALLLDMLGDLASGACLVLEREYLVRVERAHGLPPGRRQGRERTRTGTVLRDVEYPAWGLVVELDGRAFHDTARQRDLDLERDLHAAATDGRTTVRLGWGQTVRDSCLTAARVGAMLQRRGWTGAPTPCALCPPGLARLSRR